MLVSKIKNKKGSISILAIILILTITMFLAGLFDISSKTWVLNEIQSIVDISGTNALNKVIDAKILRDEIFGLDNEDYVDTTENKANLNRYANKISKEFKKQISEQVNLSGTGSIKEFNVENVNIEFSTKDKWGLGNTNKERPQIILDTISKVKIQSRSQFDVIDILTKELYNARNNSTFSVSYSGVTEDGYTELIVRSMTRLVYR